MNVVFQGKRPEVVMSHAVYKRYLYGRYQGLLRRIEISDATREMWRADRKCCLEILMGKPLSYVRWLASAISEEVIHDWLDKEISINAYHEFDSSRFSLWLIVNGYL